MSEQIPANEPAINRPPVTADVAPPTTSAESGSGQIRIGGLRIQTATLRAYTLVFALALIWIVFHYKTGGTFLRSDNLSNLLLQTAVTGILAVGMLMIIVAGQIDLSVGSVLGLAGAVAAMVQGWGLIPALAAAIIVGLVIGALQGTLVAYANIPAFIVTLGGMLAWGQNGLTLGLMKGTSIRLTLPGFQAIGLSYVAPSIGMGMAILAILFIAWLKLSRNRARRQHNLPVAGMGTTVARIVLPSVLILAFIYVMNLQGGIPISVFIMLIVALVGAFLTQNTTFGRYLYAIGGNPDAARLSGINLRRRLLMTFCIMGALTGVAAIVQNGIQGSATMRAGNNLELNAIAACVIGGTSLMGGRGTVFGAILGALIMQSLDNGMSLLNFDVYIQSIVKGTVLVAAVGIDMLGRRRA
ncbi:MAG: D-xylose transport system permease protein [Acidobacteriota bacterium]|nr:D-xylose transport system permease protein [Acidobacteriota bacterium]